MTTAELISLLKEFPDSLEVFVMDSQWGEEHIGTVSGTRYLGTGPVIVLLERKR